jgi:hypothetical protein
MADAATAAVDLILARRAWMVVARDNDRDDNGEGGNPQKTVTQKKKSASILYSFLGTP